MAESGTAETSTVDLSEYGDRVAVEYLKKQGFYSDLAVAIARILDECIRKRGIKIHSIQNRAKDPRSLARKAATPSDLDQACPKYTDPFVQITDLAGVRVITHFPSTLSDIDRLLYEEFDVVERSDKGEELLAEEKFGYQSIHCLVNISRARTALDEYERFRDAVVEVQIRTILQHAWAEIEHDIQYKSPLAIPSKIRRRFMSLAGLLEIADREFQAIQDDDKELTEQARTRVSQGDLSGVEITPDALKAFLDKRIGPDGRISDFSYDWTALLLKKLGFRTLDQVEIAIEPFDDDALSYAIWGGRQGQTTRFEHMLLAAMGLKFATRHTYAGQEWWDQRSREDLDKLLKAGVKVGDFDPLPQPSGHD